MSITMQCTCGGTTTAAIPDESTNWIDNCACGRMLLWSRPVDAQAYDPQSSGTLSINISDDSSTVDQLGG